MFYYRFKEIITLLLVGLFKMTKVRKSYKKKLLRLNTCLFFGKSLEKFRIIC